jgi:hypothetical protein
MKLARHKAMPSGDCLRENWSGGLPWEIQSKTAEGACTE